MENYEKICDIGAGSFGRVAKIERKSDGKLLAWKEINYGTMSEKEKQLIVSEVNILRELRHPNIVRYYDRVIDKRSTQLYIITEYCEGGDLLGLIRTLKAERKQIEEDRIWDYFAQLILALRNCHRHKQGTVTKPILHRDIKPANIFLDASHKTVKLGDFGLARELGSSEGFANTNVGTPFYMSPELINEQRYNESSDIWALGCLLYELAAFKPPFSASNQLALAMRINSGAFERIPGCYSEDLHRAIKWMLRVQHDRRPRVEDFDRIPQLASRFRYYELEIREFHLNHSHSMRLREIKNREEELAKREVALKAREDAITEIEAIIQRKVQELEEREQKLQECLKDNQSFGKLCDSIENMSHSPSLSDKNSNGEIDKSDMSDCRESRDVIPSFNANLVRPIPKNRYGVSKSTDWSRGFSRQDKENHFPLNRKASFNANNHFDRAFGFALRPNV